MYTNDRGSSINWVDLVVKIIFAAAFIVILYLLFPKVPNMTPFYSNVFRENIKYMQEAGEAYFTNERLPQTVGESKEITLAEMFEKKLILPFVDKDGNSCNQYMSTVKVTKEQNQYVLDVQLICNSEQDHVVKVLGCYDYCDECNSVTEYQYKKPATKKVTSYSCPKGYSRKGSYCYKNVINSKIDAIKEYYKDDTIITNASTKPGASKDEYVNPIINEGGTTYTCPSGYASIGSGSTMRCYKTASASQSYTCSGGTLYGNVCRYTTAMVCPSGYYQSGNTCYRVVSGGTYTTSAYCPSGYTRNGNSCYRSGGSSTSSYAATASKSCSTHEYTSKKSGSSYEFVDSYYKYVCSSSSNCPGYTYVYVYKVCSTSYTCPSGGSLSGSTCYVTSSGSGQYASLVCPSGYTLSGSTCYGSSSSYEYANPVCPSGYYQSGSSCYYDTSAQPRYICPSGYTQEGNSCYYYVNNTKVTGETVYSCPSGYTKTGSGIYTRCSKTVYGADTYYCSDKSAELRGTKCYKYVKGEFKGYTCPKGYSLNGKYCYKTSTEKVKATTKTTTKTVYSYKWSTEESLSGWTRTGKTRVKSGTDLASCPPCN